MKDDGTVSYYHSDHLGSSSVITDENGNEVSRYEYKPYGSVARQTGSDVVTRKFTGKELDTTGLYYFGARYYDPEIGRFIQADPTVQHPFDPQDLNRYTYCRNNPINLVDPTGYGWKWFKNLFKSFAKGFASGAAGGIVSALLFPVMGPLAFAVGGAVAGATSAALNGAGWQGILVGAGMGALIGGGLGGLACAGHGVAAWAIGGGLAIGGGALAYQQGGWEGVADYGANLAGGMVGFGAGYAAGRGIAGALAPKSSGQVKIRAKASLRVAQKPRAVKVYKQSDSGAELKGALYDGEFYPAKTAQGGEKIFRVYGGKSPQLGESWTPVDPRNTPNFADIMGLPEGNTEGAIIGARLRPGARYIELPASPLGQNQGGGLEYLLDNPRSDIAVEIIRTWNFNNKYK